jgi:hypothetical protein
MSQNPSFIPSTDGLGAPSRQCGRCRGMFEGDPTLPAGPLAEWWLCQSCRTVLLPARQRGPERNARRIGEV